MPAFSLVSRKKCRSGQVSHLRALEPVGRYSSPPGDYQSFLIRHSSLNIALIQRMHEYDIFDPDTQAAKPTSTAAQFAVFNEQRHLKSVLLPCSFFACIIILSVLSIVLQALSDHLENVSFRFSCLESKKVDALLFLYD